MAEHDEESSDQEIQEYDIREEDVQTKYRTAADVANKVMAQVVSECVPGKKIVEICSLGDSLINELVKQRYVKGKIDKGVAFPTCISPNNCVGHNSPLSDDTAVLADGDVVKIDLGVHIDGCIAVAAQTIVVSASKEVPTGRKADVILAAYYAAEAALRLLKPGRKNTEVTNAIQKVAEAFKCTPVEGVLSHQMKRYVIDGNKVIINKATLEHKVNEITFEENEVYAIDIVMSTGEGKTRETESRTTIYKRALDQNYLLKMKASRYVFNEINQRFPTFPFTVRALDEKRGRLGIVECVKHDLLQPYPVLFEKQGEYVAQFKFTALLLPSGTVRITQMDLPSVASEFSIADAELKALLQVATKKSGKKKKKHKKKAAASGAKTEAAEQAPAPTTTTTSSTSVTETKQE